ncbi:MAG: alpha-galactosidase [Phycisphaerae bacterium]
MVGSALRPHAYLAGGGTAGMESRVSRGGEGGVELYDIAVALKGGAGGLAVVEQVRLFDMDMGAAGMEVYQEQYYMPSASRGFRLLKAGAKPPAIKWWGATHGGQWDLLCHPMTVFQAGRGRSVLVGFVGNSRFENYLLWNTRGRTIRLSAWCNLFGRRVEPGQWLELEQLTVITGRTFQECVERFADRVARAGRARVPQTTVAGWSDWQYWREEKSEKDILDSLPVLARLRRAGYPLKYIVVDGGWCDHASEWLAPCAKFPRGMKWLARRLRRDGFELGLWLAPYITNIKTRVVRQHPGWLVRNAKTGKPLLRKGSNVGVANVIDYTVPEAMDWLRDIVRTMVRDWRIGYIKLDGPSMGHYLGGRFRDPSQTPVEVIRRTLEVIREECGEGVIVEGEGLFGPSIGAVDVQRVSQDNHPFWTHPTGQPCLGENIKNDLLASYMHGRYWHNHRENVILRDWLSPFSYGHLTDPPTKDGLLTDNEVQFHLTAATLAGGAMLLTDPMDMLARSPRMDLIGRFLPHHEGGRCRPVDVFRGDGAQPAVYVMDVHREFEDWKVVGVFNLGDMPADFGLRIADCGLPIPNTVRPDPDARESTIHNPQSAMPCHVFDFWNEQYLGIRKDRLDVPAVPAHGCRAFALRPVRDCPQLVGTNMHILQGAVEMETAAFDGRTSRIVVRHPDQHERKLFIWHPRRFVLGSVRTNAKDYVIDCRRKQLLCIQFNGRRRTRFDIRWNK